ncbi:MAG: ABC transporter substrate binding protein [Candidatus Omnitrophota bacterium]
MMKKHISFILIAVLIFGYCGAGFAAGEIPDVFICQSYGKDDTAAGLEMEAAMNKKLKELGYIEGKNINFYHFYMDTQTKYKGEDNINMRAGLALEEINKIDKEVDIDLLVIFDDNAFKYVALPLAKTKYKILFNGMNVYPEYDDKVVDFMETRERPGYNISGIKERSVSESAARLIKLIVPEAQTMVVLTNVNYEFIAQMGDELESDITDHPENYPFKLVEFCRVKSWEEYQAKTIEMDERDDVDVVFHYCPHGQYDKNGKGIGYEEFTNFIVTHQTHKPEFVVWTVWVRMGFICGAGVDFDKVGEKTAMQVDRVLQGESVGDIPIEFPGDFNISLNLARAQQLGIEIPFEVLGGAKEIHLEMLAYPEYKYKP